MSDEVIEQLWPIKDDMARECGYDVARLAAALLRRQGEEGHRIVDLRALRESAERPASARSGPRRAEPPTANGYAATSRFAPSATCCSFHVDVLSILPICPPSVPVDGTHARQISHLRENPLPLRLVHPELVQVALVQPPVARTC